MTFVSGHRLSGALYEQVVAPALSHTFPGLRWAALLAGRGSDVLGYDTERSMDHDWGPRLTVVLDPQDRQQLGEQVLETIEAELPDAVLGVPVDHRGAQQLPGGPVAWGSGSHGRERHHGVVVTTLGELTGDLLGLPSPDPLLGPEGLDPAQWLSIPQQSLLELTAGPLWRDDTGEVTVARRHLAFYPHDVWLHLMAARWQRIGQLEPFVGRAGEVGDDLGSHLVAASLTRDVIALALLQQRCYAPYPKWLGSALARTVDSVQIIRHLDDVRRAQTWRDRETAVVASLSELARRHDALGVTRPVDATPQPFFDRPFTVLFAAQLSDALHEAITDPAVRRLPRDVGGIDTLTDSVPALADRDLRRHLVDYWRA